MKSLQLQVALLPDLLVAPHPVNCGSVVIDTLRFTTTAAQALTAGCQSIRVTDSIEQAQSVAHHVPGQARPLLCGERNCQPIPGFDLGNSPLEYSPQRIKNHQLIFTTTNGTKAVQAVSGFEHCLLGSLVNRMAIARRIAELQTPHWQIICAGTDGEIAGEDVLAAGAIIEMLSDLTGVEIRLLNDSATLAQQFWMNAMHQPNGLESLLSSFSGGRNLIKAGYKDDVEFASQVDLLDAVPTRELNRTLFTLS